MANTHAVHVLNPLEHARGLVRAIASEVQKRVVGQDEAVVGLTAGLLLGGNVLMEGVPGIGKTLARQDARRGRSSSTSRACSSRRT